MCGTTTWRYFVLDHLGSTAAVTDGSGAVIERDAYDPWGKRRNLNGSDDTSCSLPSVALRGYTGHEHIDSECLINANARIYDPTIGRFMSPDTFVSDADNLQDRNPYSYANDRPLTLTDPTGHLACEGENNTCQGSKGPPPTLHGYESGQNFNEQCSCRFSWKIDWRPYLPPRQLGIDTSHWNTGDCAGLYEGCGGPPKKSSSLGVDMSLMIGDGPVGALDLNKDGTVFVGGGGGIGVKGILRGRPHLEIPTHWHAIKDIDVTGHDLLQFHFGTEPMGRVYKIDIGAGFNLGVDFNVYINSNGMSGSLAPGFVQGAGASVTYGLRFKPADQ